jgi:2-C-methyl-D-erythritol 4-phosphate cytidylyltransferase
MIKKRTNRKRRFVAAIIVAAGEGRRFRSRTPKQWVELRGRPLAFWALSVLHNEPLIDEIILVIDAEHRSRARTLVKNQFPKVTAIASGGKTRAASVRHGLKKVSSRAEVILIHDGVRPFIEDGLVPALIGALESYEAAVPVHLVGDTLKRLAGDAVEQTVDRKGIAAAKTPQAFRAAVIRQAHAQAETDKFEATDDSVLVERMGLRVGVIHTVWPNIKITEPEDLLLAEALLAAQGDRPV